MAGINEFLAVGIELTSADLSQEKVKKTCPFCSGDRRKKTEKCMYVWPDAGTYHCHHCERRGSVERDAGIYAKKIDEKYLLDETTLSDKMVKWFEGRKISKSTLNYYKVSEGEAFFPQLEKTRNAIKFVIYFHGVPVNIKFRDGDKNFAQVPNALKVPFGIDTAERLEHATITEGEIDAMSFYEANVFGAMSVPNGASKDHVNVNWLDNCYEELKDKKQIFLATDDDEPGRALMEALAVRLGKRRCYIVKYPAGCNDPNEVLVKHGPEVLHECHEKAEPYPIEGVVTIDNVFDSLVDIYENGFPKGDTVHMDNVNELISWHPGEVTVWTGAPGHGKSSFVDEVMTDLAMMNSWRFGIFSAEKQMVEIHTLEIYQRLLGKNFFNDTSAGPRIAYDELMAFKPFMKEHFNFLKMDKNDISVKGLLKKAAEMVEKHGIKCFIIDNWSYVEHKFPSGQSRTNYVGDALTLVREFATEYKCAVWIVAHPRKLKYDKDGILIPPGGYDVSDSAHFFNKTDNGITIYRDREKTLFTTWKIRWWFTGKLGTGALLFNSNTGKFEDTIRSASITTQVDENKFAGQDEEDFLQKASH